MRIGIALFQFFRGRIGGTAEYIERLIPGLLKVMAPEDRLVLLGNAENLAPFTDMTDPRIERIEFPWSRRTIQLLRMTDVVCPMFGSQRYAHRINDAQLDVMFCPQQSVFPRGVKARTVVTVMDLLHYRCPDQVSLWNRWIRRRKEQHLFEVCDHTISISAATRTDMELYYGIRPEKCTVVHLGGRPSLSAEGIRSPVPAGAPYLYYPAAAFPHKNHARLFAAFRQFREAHPEVPARLILSSQSSPQVDRLLKEQAAYGDILHLGYRSRPEVAAVYAHAQGVIIPTLFEGFGMPVIEGIGYGRPVCCSDLTVFHELVGNAVHYFDPLSVDDIAFAIAEMFAGRIAAPKPDTVAEIQARLNWDRCAEETYKVLRAA